MGIIVLLDEHGDAHLFEGPREEVRARIAELYPPSRLERLRIFIHRILSRS